MKHNLTAASALGEDKHMLDVSAISAQQHGYHQHGTSR